MSIPIFRLNLRSLAILFLAFSATYVFVKNNHIDYQPKDGDLVFQVCRSDQSRAIQLATHSKYSHVGIVFMIDEAPMVLEAVGPVVYTPLDRWIQNGEGQHFVAKRLIDQPIGAELAQKLRIEGERYLEKPYDAYFEWSDDRIYCSELVWKIYHKVLNLEIGQLRDWQDFDLSHPAVQEKIRERFPDAHPTDEPAISPGDMFNSHQLEQVATHASAS